MKHGVSPTVLHFHKAPLVIPRGDRYPVPLSPPCHPPDGAPLRKLTGTPSPCHPDQLRDGSRNSNEGRAAVSLRARQALGRHKGLLQKVDRYPVPLSPPPVTPVTPFSGPCQYR